MIYAMSDLHGCIEALRKQMEYVDLNGDNRIVFLGDYIDYGKESFQVLNYIWELQQEYGDQKVIVLKGNHEAMLLDWIEEYSRRNTKKSDVLSYASWLKDDSEREFNTFRTFLSEEDFQEFEAFCRKASFVEMNKKAVNLLTEKHKELIKWLSALPSFFETDTQIFVHAGVDEEAGEDWKWGTSDDILLWKYPATFGKFEKDVIAGHIGTAGLAEEAGFHDIYYDGMSHYYIDGSVYKQGKLLLMAYDEEKRKYYQMENWRQITINSMQ